MKFNKQVVNLFSVYFFDGKVLEEVDDVVSDLKTQMLEYGIDELDFIQPKFLIKAYCEIKGIDYDSIFIKSGLEKQLTPTDKVLTSIVLKNINFKFDKEIVHKKILTDLPSVLKKISTNQNVYSLTFDIKKQKQEYITYIISKNKIPLYETRGVALYDSKILFTHFIPHNLPMETEIPDSIGQQLKQSAKRLGGKPHLMNILLEEVGQLIKILETI